MCFKDKKAIYPKTPKQSDTIADGKDTNSLSSCVIMIFFIVGITNLSQDIISKDTFNDCHACVITTILTTLCINLQQLITMLSVRNGESSCNCHGRRPLPSMTTLGAEIKWNTTEKRQQLLFIFPPDYQWFVVRRLSDV